MDADQLLQAYAVQVAGEMGTNETTSTSQLMEYGKRHLRPSNSWESIPPATRCPEPSTAASTYTILSPVVAMVIGWQLLVSRAGRTLGLIHSDERQGQGGSRSLQACE